MRDVAALADASIKTVSRVINDEPGVGVEMQAKVRAAIERLDYRHDFAASALRRTDRRSDTIGMVLEDLANPFSAAVQRAVEDVARERGVLVLAGSSDEDAARERSLVHTFTNRRVDGLVLVPAGIDHSYLYTERQAGTPIVFIDRPPVFLDADAVVVDNVEGTRRGVRHLIAHGHRRIAFLGDLHSIVTAHQRHQGYVDELAAQGITLDPRLVELDLRGIESAEVAANRLLAANDPPTAFFTGQNLLTIGTVRALRRANRHHDVAIVGFDDILLADLLEPAITVIAQDAGTIGQTAAEVLFRRLDGDHSPSRHHMIPTRLITRGSGEIRPLGSTSRTGNGTRARS
jgi:LacI family transcriptional regulator